MSEIWLRNGFFILVSVLGAHIQAALEDIEAWSSPHDNGKLIVMPAQEIIRKKLSGSNLAHFTFETQLPSKLAERKEVFIAFQNLKTQAIIDKMHSKL